ncbi:hypothetical protein ACIXOK_22640 [Bacteroides fragilis]
MRASSYNISVNVDKKDLYVILNGYTRALDIVNKSVYDFLKNNGNLGHVSEDTKNKLIKRGYLTSLTHSEEIQLVKHLLDKAHKDMRFKNIIFISYFHMIVIYVVFIVTRIPF